MRPAVQGDGRGHDYTVAYLGYSGDGHLGAWNLTATAYLALGRDDEWSGRVAWFLYGSFDRRWQDIHAAGDGQEESVAD